jgi:hypothetical protein
MVKMTRARFIAASLAATAGYGILLTGCGSGTPENTVYQGTYRSVYNIPQLSESGQFNFTVDIKGKMVGSLADANSSKVRAFTGELKNTGKFEGTATYNGVSSSLRGTLATGGGGGAAPGGGSGGGDFTLSENNVTYQGSFSLGAVDQTPDQPESSEYQGNYSGVYNIPGLSQGGSISYSVDKSGKIIGSVTQGTQTGLFTGTVANTGSFTGTFAIGATPQSISGTLVKSGDGSSVGNFIVAQGSQSFAGTFGKTQTPVSGDSPYKGAYRGTYSMPEQNESGSVSFTVDPSGSITGFFSQTQNQRVGTFVASLSNDGTFSGVVKYEDVTDTQKQNDPNFFKYRDRPITGKLGTSAVGGGLAGDFVMTVTGQNNTAVNRPGNFEVGIGASEPDSIYRGSYGNSAIVPGIYLSRGSGGALPLLSSAATAENPSAQAGTNLTVTFDKQGEFLGVIGSYDFRGRATNDGRIVGTLGGVAFEGKISRQLIPSERTGGSPAVPARPGPDGVFGTDDDIAAVPEVPPTTQFKEGFAGDLIMSVNGVSYPASIAGIGGNAEGAQPR